MRQKWLSLAILLMAILYIFFIPAEPMGIKIFFKLLVMWLIMYLVYSGTKGQISRYKPFILAGLFFCMLGDGLLHWFIIGLICFFIGHCMYIAGFLQRWSYSHLRMSMILPIGLSTGYIGYHIIQALRIKGETGLILPVTAYILVISVMSWTAIMTGNKQAIAGSILFMISDSILSWNMFVAPVSHSAILIMGTYYSAQFLIANSILSPINKSHSTSASMT